MDPKATLAQALDHEQDGDIEAALLALEHYWDWRRKGGAQPEGGDRLAQCIGNRIGGCIAPRRRRRRRRNDNS